MIVTIDRPERRNAINLSVAQHLAAAFDELDDSPDLRVAVLRGAGDTFSAGADLRAAARGERSYVPGRGFAGLAERPPAKPLIAAVEGWALGGGFEIVLACDLVVAGAGARFGLPEVRRGLVAGGGGALRLPQRLPRAIAMEILLGGEPIGAHRAADLGLVNRVVPDGQALAAARELAGVVALGAPLALRAAKRVVTESPSWPPEQAFAKQSEILEPLFRSADVQEGIAAFREKRQPDWRGA
jgi:enoyl-CoA hydratase